MLIAVCSMLYAYVGLRMRVLVSTGASVLSAPE
jgi:hypothetical protein